MNTQESRLNSDTPRARQDYGECEATYENVDTLSEKAYECKTLLEYALEYARHGWSVFPCNIDKSPKTRNGLHDASKDPEQIKAWWTRWPDASIGAPTGPVNGWWVLDVDRPKKPGDPDGLVSFAELEAKYGQLPATMKQRTGGGGFHYFFKWNGQKIRNSTGKVSPGIDVRGDGGYVILPPSGHPSGGRYEWL